MELQNPNNGATPDPDDLDSTCSTPYVSAPSSPGRPGALNHYYFSAPTSPMHYILSSTAPAPTSPDLSSSGSFEFDFSSNYPASAGSSPPHSMISADELFLNGKIRPMKLSSHLQRPQTLAPLLDAGAEEEEGDDKFNVEGSVRGRELRMRSRSVHRRARSLSPMRNTWDTEPTKNNDEEVNEVEVEVDPAPAPESASSSRSSSSGRNSKRWVFLKDLLYRSKSEGRGTASATKEKFWHAFRDKKSAPSAEAKDEKKERKSADAGRRRASAHERHYTANRAAAEEMRRRTYLPYRQGLLGSLGCLGFSSRSYGAVNGFARSLNPVSTG